MTEDRFPCLCGERRAAVVKQGLSDKRTQEPRDIVRCAACGLLRTSPPPYTATGAGIYEAEDFSARVGAKELWQEFSRGLLAAVKRFKPRGTLLDVGCNAGLLVELAGKEGFSASGVDLNRAAVEYGRAHLGLDLVCGELKDADFKGSPFDVITMNHLLEHIVDMKEFLAEVSAVLKNDGIIAVGSPNAGGLIPRLGGPLALLSGRREAWYGYQVHEHIWHFTARTLARVLAENGFEVVFSTARRNMHYEFAPTWKGKMRRLLWRLFEFAGRADNLLLVVRKHR